VNLDPHLLGQLSESDYDELYRLLDAEERARSRRYIDTLFPDNGPLRRDLYVPHVRFMALGKVKKERLLIAANRGGKTTVGAFEVACHATGEYPWWWPGKVFTDPVDIWAAGKTNQTTHDIIQLTLFGKDIGVGTGKGVSGTGVIPGDAIGKIAWKVGYPSLIDTAQVRHKSGGWSTIGLKQYEQGRGAFEGTAKHVIWFDEEPPVNVYTEALTRTATTGGIVLVTFTPLEGYTDVVKMFLDVDAPDHRAYVTMTWDDVPHMTQEEKDKLLASYMPHERDARTKGVPSLGRGAIYPVPETDVVCDPFKLPLYWPRFYGMDVGWNRTAVVWFAHDLESDILYLYSEHYVGRVEPSIHAQAIRSRGEWMRGVIDPAARGRSQTDGIQLLSQYQDLGLNLTIANNAVEAGLYEVWQRLASGRLRVFSSCKNWFSEYRLYRRDEKGHIVKVDDHLMDATRYSVMSGIPLAQCAPDAGRKLANRDGGAYTAAYDPMAEMYGTPPSDDKNRQQGWMPHKGY